MPIGLEVVPRVEHVQKRGGEERGLPAMVIQLAAKAECKSSPHLEEGKRRSQNASQESLKDGSLLLFKPR